MSGCQAAPAARPGSGGERRDQGDGVQVYRKDLTPALYVAAVALGRTRDAEGVMRVAIQEIQRATGVESVSLYLLDAKRDLLVLREYAGTSSEFREHVACLSLAEERVAATAIREQRVVTSPVGDHPSARLRELYAEQGFRHLTAVPVAGREQALGLLHLASRDEPPLDPEGLSLVQAIAGLVGVALENARLREQMLVQQKRLRALAEGTLKAREDEARRIARELHDQAGQLLASVHIALDQLTGRLPHQAAALRGIHGQVDQVEEGLRRLSRELRPTVLDDLGLVPAVEWLAQGVAERTGLAIHVEASIGRLAPAVETALYRIVQESLNNVIRHAHASRVEIGLRQGPDGIRVEVRDDGRGLDVEATLHQRGDRGLGFIGMRERAEILGGQLGIRSCPGEGTEVSVTLPGEGTHDPSARGG